MYISTTATQSGIEKSISITTASFNLYLRTFQNIRDLFGIWWIRQRFAHAPVLCT